jgi:hypothetical protein
MAMGKIYMEFEEVLETKGKLESDQFNLLNYRDSVSDFANNTVNDWWSGGSAESFSQSLRNWANQFDRLAEKFTDLYLRLGREVDEWGETDMRYSYDPEGEIDTPEELGDYLNDLLSGKANKDGYSVVIDIKDLLGSNLPWDWRYPAESTTTWLQDWNGNWVKVENTGLDWSLDLTINPLKKGFEFSSEWTLWESDITWDLGDGWIGGLELKGLTMEEKVGTAGLIVGGSAAAVKASLGQNLPNDQYVGGYVGVNILGGELGATEDEYALGPVKAGLAIGKAKDPTPQETPPE